ncbi:hypothetical protein DR864_06115 [Runella rosea]|uniref:DUF11 domain-containing protein n=2 Tax=Runella rosea TaxID=2259595 RepID=A0A344TFB4_9BACT|nr:hypothetical protein DR864_06115 [Runella rosea]
MFLGNVQKPKIMKILFTIFLFLSAFLNLNAQCPGTCTYTYNGSGSTNFTLNGGETLCITGNAPSGLNINFNGSGVNTICISPGVSWTQAFGFNVSGNLVINNYGTFNMNGSYNINGGGTMEVNNNAGATLNTDSQGFGSGVIIRNSSTMTWTATSGINNQGTFQLYNDTPTSIMTATATSLFKIGNGNTFENYGIFTVSNLENEEAFRFYNDASGKITIGRYFYNHGAFLNEGLTETICGNFGSVACEFIVGDKGPGKEYINSGCVKVKGNVNFNGPGKLNEGTLIIEDGNLTINKLVTGTNGRIVVLNGTSTISVSGGFNGTNMKFCDQNTAGNAFDVVNANNQATTVVYTVDCSITDCGSAPVCTQPTRTVVATNPTCTIPGKIELTATNGDKYGISKGNTYTGPAYAAATAVGTLSVILKNNISHAADSTFTIRVFNGANDCFKDTTVTVAALPVISVPAATAACHANGTPEDATDDYMTFSINVADTPISLHTFTVTATQGGNPLAVTLSNGSPATSLNCGLEAALRTPMGSAGKGNVTLTITDNVTGCSTTLTIIDSGTCAVACVEGTPSTVSYEYATQVDVTDLDKLPIIIPKFDEQGGTRVLKSVKLEYVVGGKTTFVFENRAAQSQTFEATGTSDAFIELNGVEIANSSLTMPIPETTLPGGILVPASGNWLGDVLQGSTLTTLGRMSSWVSDYLTLFKDPRTDPRWVTNATGNAVNDDDMLLVPMVEDTAKGSFTYTTVGDLAPFIGTGNVPLNVSTLSGLSLSGGGGNIFAIQRTRAYASAKVTYTYECVELCIKPIAVVSVKSQTICAGDNASAYTVAPSTGVDYKWYGPLADTTSNLGTAIAGQTTASYTPTGTALTTAGTKYYAVIINTTGDSTCADTAFVTLTVNAKPIIADGAATICEGETVDLTSKIIDYASLLNPTWTIATAGGTSVSTPTNVSPITTTTYVLVAENASGCKDTASVVVTVNPKPTIATASSFPACRLNGTAYTIKFTATGGTVTTVPSLTITGDSIANIPLTTASVKLIITGAGGCKDSITVTAPACDKPVGSIGDLIWKDANDNGLQDLPTEKGVVGVKVNLYAASGGTKTGPVLQTKTTDNDGLYLFRNLSAGDYIVEIDQTSLPDTCVITTKQNTLSDDTKDSDFNPSSGLSQVITLAPVFNPTTPADSLATNNLTVDAGLVVPCIKSNITLTTAPVCSPDVQTYSLTFSVTNKMGMVKVDKGVLTGNNPYTVTGIPTGATLKITDSLSAVCKFDTLITGPNCNCNPPLPVLITPSLTACIGDTFPTIKATVVGLATVEWFTAASGGAAVFTGLNYKPVGSVTGDTVFYAQARSTDTSCPAAISTGRVAVTINAQNCTVEVDLALRKSINTKIAQIGDTLTYTIKVFNQSNTAATGVEVADSIATTVQFVAGSFVASRGSASISGNVITWTIGGIAANAGANGDTVTLTYKVKAVQEGVHFNTAEISKTNEKDIDSTPGDGKLGEDDIESQCFTVPFKLCPTEKVEVNVPVFLTNVQWFKNGGTAPIAAGNTVLLTEIGTYTFTASNQTCPANGCCPIIIEPGVNCCPEDLCIPFTIQKVKKK